MLVLTRRLSDTIHIGDDIVITIVRVTPNTVRIGVTAPRDIKVRRGELTVEEHAAREPVPTVIHA